MPTPGMTKREPTVQFRFAMALVALAIAASAVQAQTNVHRWVDKDGKVHFSDTPPPKDAREATQKRFGGGPGDEGQMPYATQLAMKKSPVTLYTSSDCGELCAQGRELLSRRGIPFSERNAQANAADAEALKKIVGALQVPVLMVGDNALKGYSEETWQAALDGAGYPRTRLPGQPAPRSEPPSAAPAPAEPTKGR